MRRTLKGARGVLWFPLFAVLVGTVSLLFVPSACSSREKEEVVTGKKYILTWRCKEDRLYCREKDATLVFDGKEVGAGNEGVRELEKINVNKPDRILIRKPWMDRKNGMSWIVCCPARIVDKSPYIDKGIISKWERLGLLTVHRLTWRDKKSEWLAGRTETEYYFDGKTVGRETEATKKLMHLEIQNNSVVLMKGPYHSYLELGGSLRCVIKVPPFFGSGLHRRWTGKGIILEHSDLIEGGF